MGNVKGRIVDNTKTGDKTSFENISPLKSAIVHQSRKVSEHGHTRSQLEKTGHSRECAPFVHRSGHSECYGDISPATARKHREPMGSTMIPSVFQHSSRSHILR